MFCNGRGGRQALFCFCYLAANKALNVIKTRLFCIFCRMKNIGHQYFEKAYLRKKRLYRKIYKFIKTFLFTQPCLVVPNPKKISITEKTVRH